jgi:hypothetical protein
MLMLRVIPLVQLASQCLKAEGIKLQRCQVSLKRDDARNLAWEIDARPVREISVAIDGAVDAQ